MCEILGEGVNEGGRAIQFFVWQIAVTAHEAREMSDSWVNACAGFLPQTWIWVQTQSENGNIH